jgi:hypothetical protein
MEYIREQRIKYGEQGVQSTSDAVYVNVAADFEPLVKKFKVCTKAKSF